MKGSIFYTRHKNLEGRLQVFISLPYFIASKITQDSFLCNFSKKKQVGTETRVWHDPSCHLLLLLPVVLQEGTFDPKSAPRIGLQPPKVNPPKKIVVSPVDVFVAKRTRKKDETLSLMDHGCSHGW